MPWNLTFIILKSYKQWQMKFWVQLYHQICNMAINKKVFCMTQKSIILTQHFDHSYLSITNIFTKCNAYSNDLKIFSLYLGSVMALAIHSIGFQRQDDCSCIFLFYILVTHIISLLMQAHRLPNTTHTSFQVSVSCDDVLSGGPSPCVLMTEKQWEVYVF